MVTSNIVHSRGYLMLVLHAHLPYVRHPEYLHFHEEKWLYQAITEAYLPLLTMCDRLCAEQVPFRITVSLSPTLMTMLHDELLTERYVAHLKRILRLADKEVDYTRDKPEFHGLAHMYRRDLSDTLDLFERRYQRDLLRAFKEKQRTGCLELITTAATHGYLPLLQPAAARAQVRNGLRVFQRFFDTDPAGFWLPECGYTPGLEDMLKEHGICWFLVDSHGLLHADAQPKHGIFAPLACANGVAAFGRDPDSSRQVWSATEGYPGDFAYREYYRDICDERDEQYLQDCLCNPPFSSGLKYFRITGRNGEKKQPYDPALARQRACTHARDFVIRRMEQIRDQAPRMNRPPALTAPFDAELFGHWWFEGPLWMEEVARYAAEHGETLRLITPSDYLQRHTLLQQATPSASSWGDRGYNEYWLNANNDWIYPYLHEACRRMQALVKTHAAAPAATTRHRALRQAARTLLLAQASDWPFIMKSGTMVDYARQRVSTLLSRFFCLEEALRKPEPPDHAMLEALEYMDRIFPDVDVSAFVEDR